MCKGVLLHFSKAIPCQHVQPPIEATNNPNPVGGMVYAAGRACKFRGGKNLSRAF